MAAGSVIRTTCCAVVWKTKKSKLSALAKVFFIRDFRINKIYKICLQLFHKDGTEFVNDPKSWRKVMAKAKASKKSADSQVTTDHEEIRRWVEERGGQPARVKGRDLLRIDYPGFSGEDTLEPMDWEEFFQVFDENNLAFLYQETTKDGGESRFSKFVDRDSVEE
jgi:hypothetical protein